MPTTRPIDAGIAKDQGIGIDLGGAFGIEVPRSTAQSTTDDNQSDKPVFHRLNLCFTPLPQSTTLTKPSTGVKGVPDELAGVGADYPASLRLGAILGWCIIVATPVCILHQTGWEAILQSVINDCYQ